MATLGPGTQRAAKRLSAKLAAHPPLVQGSPSRQVQRRASFKAEKRLAKSRRDTANAAALADWRRAA